MANDKPLASGSYTIVDITDQVSLYSYIKCNVTTNQFLSNKNEYSPDYSITNPVLEAEIYKVNEKDNLIGEKKVISSKWLYKVGNSEWTEISINTNGFELIGTSPKFTSLKIKSNFMDRENPSLIIRNLTEYQEVWMQTSVVQLTDLDFSLSVQGSAGLDAYTVVVDNENQSLSCLPDGTIIDGEIGPNGRAKTKIEVFKGTTKLTAVNENPGKGQFACSLNNLTGATTFAKESDNCTFYLDGVNSDLGKAVIDVYLEGTTLKTQKTFSFNKSKDGEGGADAYSIDIVGPNQFIYDANDNYTPEKITLNVIGQNFTPSKDNIQWQYKNGNSWTNLSKGLSIDITPSTAGWLDKELRLRAVYLGNVSIYDEFTVYKVQDGKHTVSFYLTTPNGNTIRNEDKKSLLIEAKLYYGEINKSNTNEVTYTWFKQNTDMSWVEFKTISDGSIGGNNLEVFADDILVTANFKCVASYEGKTYEDIATLNDFSDPYVTNISNVGGTAFKNGIGKTHLSCDINRGTEVLDVVPLVTNIPEVNNYNNGDIIYVIADDKYIEKVNGAWSILTDAPSEDNKKSNFTYKWRKTNKDGTTSPTLVSNGKVCKILASEIDETATYSVELELNGSVISFSQITITNTNDGQDGSDGTDGKDSYSVQLANESHIIACDYKGIPKLDEIGAPTSKARSSIIAKRGDVLLSPISTLEALSKDKYKYEILSNDTCEVARIDDESFYIKNVYTDSGYVDIKVYAESTDNVFTKKFTWSKLIDAENAKYVVLSGDNTFKYDDKNDSTPTPVNLKITADVFNIDSYTLKWQYKNANDTVYKDITSDVGSLISENTLTINDTKLFDAGIKNIVIKCIAIDSSDSKQYFSTFSVFKVYDGSDGSNGSDGADSKIVKITGINQIKYTGDTPNYTSITLTATPTNYTSPTYVWSKLNGSTFEDISDNGSLKENELMLDVSGLSDTNLFRVKCSESNSKDVSFDEFQVVKVYDGTDANEYLLRIVNGTRSLVYNGKNNLITTQIAPFEIEVYKNGINITDTNLINNILWECNGYFTQPTVVGQITFKPVPLPRYDMEDMTKLNTNVLVTVNVEGRILKDYVAIAVSKNSTALDWVDDWDNSKVEIGSNYFISPRIFAGTKNTQTNNITGLALGRDIVQNSPLIGMAIYYENNIVGKILSTPDSDSNMVILGKDSGNQVKVKSNGKVVIEGGVEVSNKTFTKFIGDVESKCQTFTSTPTVPYYVGDLWITNLTGTGVVKTCKTSRTTGSFTANEWVEGLKYTDDSLANNAYVEAKNATSKLTQDGLTTIIGKYYTTDADVTSKGYQTSSQVQQAVDNFEQRFIESGGYNKVKNSALRNGTSYWTYLSWNNFAGNAGATGNFGVIEPGDKWCLQNRNVLQAYAWGLNTSLDNGDVLGVGIDSAGMWGGVDWTFSCLLASHRANSVIIEIIELDANGNRMPEVNSWSVIAKSGGSDRNNWTRVCEKFTLKNQGCAQFFVRIFLGSWNREEDSAYLFIAEPQVVLGHKDVPYTLSSDEFYSGIVRSDMNGVIVSMADGEGSQGYSRMAYDGFSIFDSNGNRKAWFGDSDSAYIQQLSADDIFCNKVVKYATERPTNFYVSTTATGDGTGRNISNKSNSLNHTLDYIKNTYGQVSCRQDIVIYVDDGIYNESVYIGGWMGTGLLYVNFGKAVVWYGNFIIEENQMVILLQGQKTNIDINDGATLETRNGQPTVYVRNSTCRVSAFKARCEGGYYNGTFLRADLGATAMVYYNDLVGFSAVAQANNMSTVYVVDNIGDVDVVAGWGGTGTIIMSGYCPFLKNNHLTWQNYATHEVDLGCIQKNSVWIPRVDATPTPPPTPSVTWQTFSKSFTVTNLRSVPEGTGSVTSGIASCMAQGYWGSYKAHRGYGDLGDSPASWCSGGRNFSITCTMRRKNSSHGNNSATPHPIFIHTDGSSWDSGTYYGRGEAKTFTFPSSIASAIASGSMKTLQIWAGRSTAQYSHYDAVSITITCEKQV